MGDAKKGLGNVCVVGLGLIGSSFGLALRRAGLAEYVFGLDVDEGARRMAEESGAVEQTFDTLNHLASADVVVLAVPPPDIIPCLLEADVFCKDGAVVTDTGSVKESIVSWTISYPLKFRPHFVGGHPMVGKETSGGNQADGAMFDGAAWVLTPVAETDRKALATVRRMIEGIGARPLELTPEEHDRHAAILSHLPHIIASALMRMSANLTHSEMAGPSWADLTRVAASSPELWQGIFATNREQVVSALQDIEFFLEEMRQYIESHDDQMVLDLLTESKRLKDESMP